MIELVLQTPLPRLLQGQAGSQVHPLITRSGPVFLVTSPHPESSVNKSSGVVSGTFVFQGLRARTKTRQILYHPLPIKLDSQAAWLNPRWTFNDFLLNRMCLQAFSWPADSMSGADKSRMIDPGSCPSPIRQRRPLLPWGAIKGRREERRRRGLS